LTRLHVRRVHRRLGESTAPDVVDPVGYLRPHGRVVRFVVLRLLSGDDPGRSGGATDETGQESERRRIRSIDRTAGDEYGRLTGVFSD
jgi:hypothetical protein